MKLTDLALIVSAVMAILFSVFADLEAVFKGVIFFIPVIALAAFTIAMVYSYSKKTGESGAGTKFRSLINNVPNNSVWVVRNAFSSFPGMPLMGIYAGEREKFKKGEREKFKKNGNDEQRQEREKNLRKPRGYKEKKEGWRFWIPGLQVDEGIVNYNPVQRDIKNVKVNTQDSQVVIIDLQMTSFIRDASRFVISMEGDTIEEKMKKKIGVEDELIHSACNTACSGFISEQLQALNQKVQEDDKHAQWTALKSVFPLKIDAESRKVDVSRDYYVEVPNPDDHANPFKFYENDEEEEKGQYWEILTKKFQPKDDDSESNDQQSEKKKYIDVPIKLGVLIKHEVKRLFIPELYGIRIGQIGTQRIYVPDVVQAALERERAAKIERRAADDESQAMSKMIRETGANATAVMITNTLVDGLRHYFGNAGKKGGKKDGKKDG